MLNELNKTLLALPSRAWTVEITDEMIAFALLLGFVGLSNLENRLPKLNYSVKQLRKSYQLNTSLFVVNSLLMSLCSIATLYVIAEHYASYGVLNYVSNPVLKAILSFLAIDLLLYAWHRACHRFDLFWMFHRVHHNDPYLNVSTAFRLHFLEILLTNCLKALLIIALGIDKMLVLLIEAVVTLCIMFHHTNTSFKYEQLLSRFMIVPFLHRVHHSTERSEHDRNYGAVLSIWDRLFATILEIEPKKIGIKGDSPQDLLGLMAFGFGWNCPVTPIAIELPVNFEVMIAEAAYYKAEKRNFRPGYDYRDWLEAKGEILAQVHGTKSQQNNSGLKGIQVKVQNFFHGLKPQYIKDLIQFNLR